MIVDLFAGPGGLDVGAHWLGVPSIGIEFDESAVETREAAGLSTVVADVRSWKPTDFTGAFNVLTGGPPCQTFTVAGNGHGRRALDDVVRLVGMVSARKIDEVLEEVEAYADKRTGLVLQPLIWAIRAIDADQPYAAIMLEQVPAVRPVWHAMAAVLEAEGYGVDVDVLRTEQYGVPQTRRRAVLIARRGIPSECVRLPKPTHQKYVGTHVDAAPVLDLDCELPQWISMGEVLDIAESFTVISNYGSGGDPKNRSRRHSDRPAFTVTGKASRNRVLIEGDDSRRFGHSESGRLQTFPHDFPWNGRDISQQIGNAIPPRLGAHVLNALLGRQLDLDEKFFRGLRAGWDGQDEATAVQIRDAITRTEVIGKPLEEVVRLACGVAPSKGERRDEFLGVVGGSPEVDAVEPEPRHRPRVEAAL